MSGTVKSAKLESRTARARLKRGRQPHWRTVVSGRAHLGYQRRLDAPEGRWILRRYDGVKYSIEPLGLSDDAVEADGHHILSFEQAEAKARALLDAPRMAVRRLTVREALNRYIEFKRAAGQPTGDLQSRASAHILPTLGDRLVKELTPEILRNWLATLAALPAMKRSPSNGKQAYKPVPTDAEGTRRRRASANRVLTMLKAALNHAYDEGYVPQNDAWGRKLKPFRSVDQARIRWLSVEEAKRLLNGCDTDFRKLVHGALLTGCRYSELARLQVQDFSLDSGTVAVRISKSGFARHVVLTDEGISFFSELCAGRAGSELAFKNSIRRSRSRDPDGGEWRPSEQVRAMKDASQRASISPPINFHALRHTWASLSVMNGMPLMVVAKNLGHTDTRMVEKHYGHMGANYVATAVRAGAPQFGFSPDPHLSSIHRKDRPRSA
jgi:integrase